MRVVVMVVTVALVTALASACGGNSGPSSGDRTASAGATATAVTVDTQAAALTALVLQPADVPAGLPHTESFGNEYGQVISYSTRYGDDTFSITSSVGHAAPGKSIDQLVLRLRQLQNSLYKAERNYTLDGADQAFAYGYEQSKTTATLALKDGYYISIVMSTSDNARLADVQDQATLDRYTTTVFDRLKAYLADPSSVTPVPGAPPFIPPAPSAAETPAASTD